MKRLYSLTALICLTFIGLSAQHDTKSKEMLDKLSSKNKAYKTMEVEFTFQIVNKDDNINETQKGTLKMKGDKYYLKLADKEIFCDAKKVYTYSKDLGECQVISVDELEKDAMTPKSMFTIYEEGFKSKVKEEKKDKTGRNIMTIDLYPLKPKEKDYTMVRLDVDKDKEEFVKATILGKNGSVYYYTVTELTANTNMDDVIFNFDKTKYPKVKMIE
jgi:outer membrane lipoprotein-sorting protein